MEEVLEKYDPYSDYVSGVLGRHIRESDRSVPELHALKQTMAVMPTHEV